MQSTINVAQAFGLVGSIYDLTPYRVDAYEVATAVNIGGIAGRKSDGTIGAMDNSVYTTFAGIFVRPHEAVNYGTVDTVTYKASPLGASLAQPAGATVQVCSMGRVVVNFTLSANSEANAKAATLADGTAIYVTPAGVLTTDADDGESSPTAYTLVGKVIKGIAAGADGVSGASTSWTKVQPIVLQLG